MQCVWNAGRINYLLILAGGGSEKPMVWAITDGLKLGVLVNWSKDRRGGRSVDGNAGFFGFFVATILNNALKRVLEGA